MCVCVCVRGRGRETEREKREGAEDGVEREGEREKGEEGKKQREMQIPKSYPLEILILCILGDTELHATFSGILRSTVPENRTRSYLWN